METIMEKDQHNRDHGSDLPGRMEELLKSEKKQTERPGSQDEWLGLVNELQARRTALEKENEELKKALSELAKMELYTPCSISPPRAFFSWSAMQ